jgi:hypothetical protein
LLDRRIFLASHEPGNFERRLAKLEQTVRKMRSPKRRAPSYAAVEAYEGVEQGLMTEEDFRDFVFTNPIKLHCGMNPGFFEGTIVQEQARNAMRELGLGAKALASGHKASGSQA